MNWLEVLEHIEAGEDQGTEFKRGFGDFSAIGKTICAFANGNGGLLVIGVVNKTGDIVGVQDNPEKIYERLTNFLHTGCNKPVSVDCGRHEDTNGWVFWVVVYRQQRGYEPFSYDGKFWVRRGRSTVAPSPSELQELMNTFGFILTEEQVIPSANIEDIDIGRFRSFMRKQGLEMDKSPQPNLEDDLYNASVIDKHDGFRCPTLYGLMVFGKEPQSHPHTTYFYLDCAAYSGADRSSDVISVSEAKGGLEDQIKFSIGWFNSLGRQERYRGIYRNDIPLVPEDVLREAVVNAVIHRDYAVTGSKVMLEVFSDRIDVTSPGTLPNHMTVDQVRSGGTPRSRNEMIANAMVVTGLMEQRGRGWLLMRRKMKEFNSSEPELANEESGRYVRVTLRLNLD